MLFLMEIARSIAEHHISIKTLPSEEITLSTVATICSYLVVSDCLHTTTKTHLVFVKARLMNLKWICGNHHSCIVRSLRVMLISAISPRMLLCVCFFFLLLLSMRGTVSPLAFPTTIALTLQVRTWCGGFYQLPSIPSRCYIWGQGNDHGWSTDPGQCLHQELDLDLGFQTAKHQCQLGPCKMTSKWAVSFLQCVEFLSTVS